MPKRLKIGIVGCGAIGSSLAKALVKKFAKEAELSALYDLNEDKTRKLSAVLNVKNLAADNLKSLVRKSELVIEAASAKVSWEIAKMVLSSGKDIMIMSVGGVSSRLKQLSALAKKNNSKVYIPSGALSGIDAVKAAAIGKINKAVLTTTKNPLSFKGVKYVEETGIDLAKIKKETVLFSGKAKDAVKYFPQNINVAAVLSLAGIGENRTLIKIIASPKVTRNTHEVRIIAPAADIFTRTENVLHPDNPKTSFLAVLSAIAMLRNILEPVRIGT